MKFKVGPWIYRVLVEDPVVDDAGEVVHGLCRPKTREIVISASLPLSQRVEVLFHELRHAWQFHGLAASRCHESEADNVAAFALDVNQQFRQQGGEAAMMRLGSVPLALPAAAAEMRAAQCPTCGGLLNMPIRTGVPEYDADMEAMIARREADCEFCGRAMTWREIVTGAGRPTGRIVADSVVTPPPSEGHVSAPEDPEHGANPASDGQSNVRMDEHVDKQGRDAQDKHERG